MHPVKLPAWLERVLRLPGGALLVAIILLPLTIVRGLLLLFWEWGDQILQLPGRAMALLPCCQC